MANSTYSPLRYPGGKRKLYKYTKRLIESNNLDACTYIEPFAGGAGLALALLFNGVVNNIILNDIDRSIYAFWHCVLYETDDFCKLIKNISINMDEWYIQKEIQSQKESISILELGFSTFFLNRTNRSGIIKAGVIGGKEQLGTYKLDCRFNKDNLIKRIREIAAYRDSIQFYNLDATQFINEVITDQPNNSLVFLDPPYYKKGPGLYENHYTHEDHQNLSIEIANNIHQPWVVTYDNVDPIKEFYHLFTQQEYDLNYSAQQKYKGQEIMIYSDNINPVKI